MRQTKSKAAGQVAMASMVDVKIVEWMISFRDKTYRVGSQIINEIETHFVDDFTTVVNLLKDQGPRALATVTHFLRVLSKAHNYILQSMPLIPFSEIFSRVDGDSIDLSELIFTNLASFVLTQQLNIFECEFEPNSFMRGGDAGNKIFTMASKLSFIDPKAMTYQKFMEQNDARLQVEFQHWGYQGLNKTMNDMVYSSVNSAPEVRFNKTLFITLMRSLPERYTYQALAKFQDLAWEVVFKS